MSLWSDRKYFDRPIIFYWPVLPCLRAVRHSPLHFQLSARLSRSPDRISWGRRVYLADHQLCPMSCWWIQWLRPFRIRSKHVQIKAITKSSSGSIWSISYFYDGCELTHIFRIPETYHGKIILSISNISIGSVNGILCYILCFFGFIEQFYNSYSCAQNFVCGFSENRVAQAQ